jgi:hypothetical protein
VRLRIEGDVVMCEYDAELGHYVIVLENVNPMNDRPILLMDRPKPLERVTLTTEDVAVHGEGYDAAGSRE